MSHLSPTHDISTLSLMSYSHVPLLTCTNVSPMSYLDILPLARLPRTL
jgi:hypothetical protein